VREPNTGLLLNALEQHWRDGIDVWRAVALESETPTLLYELEGEACDHSAPDNGLTATMFRDANGTHIATDRDGQRWLLDRCRAHQPQVVLFGAGHVGAAIVRVLGTLPCRILWVDEREDMFPADLPLQVTLEATDVPNAVVDQAEPGAYFLVMTHSHALDQQLSERILKRKDIAWFGLIGSYTKRKQFEHRPARARYQAGTVEQDDLPDRHSGHLWQGTRQHRDCGGGATDAIMGTASAATTTKARRSTRDTPAGRPALNSPDRRLQQ